LIAGELIALVTTKVLLNRAKGLAIVHDFDRILTFVAASGVVFAWAWVLRAPTLVGVALCVVGSAIVIGRLVMAERATIDQGFLLSTKMLQQVRRLFRRDRSSASPVRPLATATDAENRLV